VSFYTVVFAIVPMTFHDLYLVLISLLRQGLCTPSDTHASLVSPYPCVLPLQCLSVLSALFSSRSVRAASCGRHSCSSLGCFFHANVMPHAFFPAVVLSISSHHSIASLALASTTSPQLCISCTTLMYFYFYHLSSCLSPANPAARPVPSHPIASPNFVQYLHVLVQSLFSRAAGVFCLHASSIVHL
jgi:hypothetical protein